MHSMTWLFSMKRQCSPVFTDRCYFHSLKIDLYIGYNLIERVELIRRQVYHYYLTDITEFE